MRRIVVIATALAVLVGAVSAYAATGGFNTYTASIKFSPNKAGSKKAPAAIAFTEKYVANGTGGNRTAPLTNIKTMLYGVVASGKGFPTCSQAKIAAAQSDAGCPKGALVATGAITAILGPVADPSTTDPNQIPCNPLLHVWNGGGGKIVFFFVEQVPGSHVRRPIQTGAVGPFVGTVKQVGKNLVQDTPIPGNVSFPLSRGRGLADLRDPALPEGDPEGQRQDRRLQHVGGLQERQAPVQRDVHAPRPPPAPPSQSDTVSGTQKCS